MAVLLFVESKHKVERFREMAKARWPDTLVDVMFTGGHLLTLDTRQESGWLLHDLTVTGMRLTDGAISLVARVKEKLRNGHAWSHVVIASDDDLEGESIAEQLYMVTRELMPEARCYRLRVPALTMGHFFAAALEEQVDANMIRARNARVVADALLHAFMRHDAQLPEDSRPGRLTLAAANQVRLRHGETPELQTSVYVGLPFGTAVATVPQHVDPRGVVGLASRLDISDFQAGPEISVPTPPPLNIFSLASELAGREIRNGMELAQLAYSLGRVSYFRTEQTALPAEQIAMMRRYGRVLGLARHEEDSATAASGSLLGSSHPGIHPLAPWLEKPAQNKEQAHVERLIAAYAIGSTLTAAKYHDFTVTKGRKYPVTFSLRTFEKRGWTAAHERLNLVNPLWRLPVLEAGVTTRHTPKQKIMDYHILRWCIDAKLGRPSSIGHVPDRLRRTGWLTWQNEPTDNAKDWIRSVNDLAPDAVSPELTQQLEHAVAQIRRGEQERKAMDVVLTALRYTERDLKRIGVISERPYDPWKAQVMGL